MSTELQFMYIYVLSFSAIKSVKHSSLGFFFKSLQQAEVLDGFWLDEVARSHLLIFLMGFQSSGHIFVCSLSSFTIIFWKDQSDEMEASNLSLAVQFLILLIKYFFKSLMSVKAQFLN